MQADKENRAVGEGFEEAAAQDHREQRLQKCVNLFPHAYNAPRWSRGKEAVQKYETVKEVMDDFFGPPIFNEFSEMRKVHNWLSDHTEKEESIQGRLIYSLIVMDLRRELTDFEKRAEAFEEAGNKNKSADQETIEYITRTSDAFIFTKLH
ncbi:hypothetical protein B9Z55_021520 [Caenorhabditis nigoni]|nr:hypothetical protein B9Z55_021520 [Caenorhabditis nigoni]